MGETLFPLPRTRIWGIGAVKGAGRNPKKNQPDLLLFGPGNARTDVVSALCCPAERNLPTRTIL
jgi:hypothetical protein